MRVGQGVGLRQLDLCRVLHKCSGGGAGGGAATIGFVLKTPEWPGRSFMLILGSH